MKVQKQGSHWHLVAESDDELALLSFADLNGPEIRVTILRRGHVGTDEGSHRCDRITVSLDYERPILLVAGRKAIGGLRRVTKLLSVALRLRFIK